MVDWERSMPVRTNYRSFISGLGMRIAGFVLCDSGHVPLAGSAYTYAYAEHWGIDRWISAGT